jgi:hypothetical protein
MLPPITVRITIKRMSLVNMFITLLLNYVYRMDFLAWRIG